MSSRFLATRRLPERRRATEEEEEEEAEEERAATATRWLSKCDCDPDKVRPIKATTEKRKKGSLASKEEEPRREERLEEEEEARDEEEEESEERVVLAGWEFRPNRPSWVFDSVCESPDGEPRKRPEMRK